MKNFEEAKLNVVAFDANVIVTTSMNMCADGSCEGCPQNSGCNDSQW